jgi:HSP20 family protein
MEWSDGVISPEGDQGGHGLLKRFDPFWEFDHPGDTLDAGSFEGRRAHSMPIDAFRKSDEFSVYLDLPGVDADSIELTPKN